MLFTLQQADIIRFCAGECDRQRTGPLAVTDMLMAYNVLVGWDEENYELGVTAIHNLGQIIDPEANPNGRFRIGPAVFDNGTSALEAQYIEAGLVELMKLCHEISAETLYREFQFIHPFKDGNGRVGALLYNWKNGTLYQPLTPPRIV